MIGDNHRFSSMLKSARELVSEGDETLTLGVRGLELTKLAGQYNAPTSNEVATVIPGDGDTPVGPRDLIITVQGGGGALSVHVCRVPSCQRALCVVRCAGASADERLRRARVVFGPACRTIY